jgi:ubiquinone/menaquinone biosynthesis C-methylase UbiE
MTATLPAETAQAPGHHEIVEELVGRIFLEGVGTMHLFTAYLGVKLGLFKELDARGPSTAVELADATSLDGWYVRDWLQSEATAGLVEADVEDLQVARFRLAPGVREVLVDDTAASYLGGLTLAAGAVGTITPSLLDAFHTGKGVPYSAYGEDALEAQSALNRPAFINELVADWLPQIPDVLARAQDRTKPALVADVGCGYGWAAIELAKAFPHLRVDGYDTDEASISRARRNAEEAGVSDQVSFSVVDAEAGAYGGRRYDVIFFFECLHDMAHPVLALEGARNALADGGTVIVMDENVTDVLTPGDPAQIFFATASVLWCVPQGRVDPTSETPGPVMRPAMFESIARRAGFTAVEVLPIEHPFWRFYRPIV